MGSEERREIGVGIGHDLVHPGRFLVESGSQPAPFPLVLLLEIEKPGRKHDINPGKFLPQERRKRFGKLQIAVRAPGPAGLAGASALVVRPDPDVRDMDPARGECVQELPAVPKDQIHSARTGRADLRPVMGGPSDPLRTQFFRRGSVALIGKHRQAGTHAGRLARPENLRKPVQHRHGGRVVNPGVVMHVEPDLEAVIPP